MQATTTSKIVDRASLTPECAKKPPSENAQTIPQVNAHAEHVQLLLSTIERLSEHLDLDGQLAALQQARAALMEEAQVRTQVQQTSKTTNELSDLQQQVYSLTGENSEMKLELLRWRKKTAVLKLKLSSCEESCHHLMDNQASNKEAMKELEENKQTLSAHNKDLAHQLASALKSLSDLEARYKEQQSHLSSSESSSADLELKLRNLSIDYERATRHIASLEKDMASLVSRNEVAEKSHDLAVTAQKLAEEKASMAEAALSSWKQFEVDRKRLMKEREDQLKELAEERSRLSSDRAHIAEGKAQAQIAILQSQLDNEVGVRHQSELSLKQQLLASKERCDVERRRADKLEQQLLSMEQQVVELTSASQRHRAPAASKKAAGARNQQPRQEEASVSMGTADRAVDDFIDQLIPVIEEEEEEEVAEKTKRQTAKKAAPKASSSLPLMPWQKMAQSIKPPPPLASATETVAAAFATASAKVKAKNKAKEAEGTKEEVSKEVAPTEKPTRVRKVSKSLREESEEEDEREEEDEEEDEFVPPRAAKALKAEPKAKRARKTALVPLAPEPNFKSSKSKEASRAPNLNPMQQGADFEDLHRELDEGGHTLPDTYEEEADDQVENQWPASSQPAPAVSHKVGPAQGFWSQQDPALSQRAQLSDVMASFRARSTLNPLAALNSRVLEAAAARRGRVSLGGGNRRISLGGGNAGAQKKRRTSLKPNAAPLAGGSDVLPASMLFDSLLKVPKMK